MLNRPKRYYFYSIHGHDDLTQPFYEAINESQTDLALTYIANPILQRADIMHYPLSIAISKGQREIIDAILLANGSLKEKLDTGVRNQYYQADTDKDISFQEIACGRGYPLRTACDFAILALLNLLRNKKLESAAEQQILSTFDYVLSKGAEIELKESYYHLLNKFDSKNILVMRLKAGLIDSLYRSETTKKHVMNVLNNEPELTEYVTKNYSAPSQSKDEDKREAWIVNLANIMQQSGITSAMSSQSAAVQSVTLHVEGTTSHTKLANNPMAFSYASNSKNKPSPSVAENSAQEEHKARRCTIL